MSNDLWKSFDNGSLSMPGSTKEFADIPYTPGVISTLPADVPHEVNAGDNGLYLFAKFMPALC